MLLQGTIATNALDVSPDLFRTAAASTAALYGGNTPHLASAILGHTDPRIADEHYICTTSISAANAYADIIESLRRTERQARFQHGECMLSPDARPCVRLTAGEGSRHHTFFACRSRALRLSVRFAAHFGT